MDGVRGEPSQQSRASIEVLRRGIGVLESYSPFSLGAALVVWPTYGTDTFSIGGCFFVRNIRVHSTKAFIALFESIML